MRVVLAGEGRNELGGFAVEAAFRAADPRSLQRWLARAREALGEAEVKGGERS